MRPARPLAMCCALVTAVAALAGRAAAVPTEDETDPAYETVVRAAEPQRAGASVQVIDARELARSGAQTVQEALQRLAGVHLQDEQGNAAQQGLSLRGVSASPVTGLPQGVSVFVDGLRVNEPAGEEVNFDLLPLADVARIEVVRGPAAPLGRNTIGGAIHIHTRRAGRRGVSVEASSGSPSTQLRLRLRGGGRVGPLDGYVSIGHTFDRGFRLRGASQLSQLLGKIGYRRAGTDLSLSYQYQLDRIEQPGSLPRSLLERDRALNFTAGDFFAPELHQLILNATRRLRAGFALAGNLSLRSLHAQQFNSNLLDSDTRLYNNTLTPAGALRLSHTLRRARVRNRVTAGLELAQSGVSLLVLKEDAACGGASCAARQLSSQLTDDQLALGAYLQDSLRLGGGLLGAHGSLTITASLRYDQLRHRIVDLSPDSPGAASGDASYRRFTPAVSLSYSPWRGYALAFSYAEGFRAPAFLELTCADPTAPCIGLQAGVAPDTGFARLRPVRARAYELRLSAAPLPGLEGTLALYRADLFDDIFSVSPGTTSIYFGNVGDTRRQGIELRLRGARRGWEGQLSYAYSRATFEQDLSLASPRTPGIDQQVRQGAELPLSPNHHLSAALWWRPWRWIEAGADVTYVSSQVLRGDEANTQARLEGAVVVGLAARLRLGRLSGFARLSNLLNRTYETFGTFAQNARVEGRPIEPFLTPAPPIRLVAGASYRFE